MKQDEAEKLAAHIRNSDDLWFWKAEIYRLCDHILSGDMKREIESAAYERAVALLQAREPYSCAWATQTSLIRSLIQPPVQKEDGK